LRHQVARVEKIRIYCALAAVVFCLAGCEAPLNLTGVQQELKNPLHRYDQFQAIARHDQQVVVVGNSGIVLLSQDNGQSWARQELPSRPALIDVSRCPSGQFIALDAARKLWLSDAGSAWRSQAIETAEAVMALTCDPQNRIWVVGGFSTILSSTDQGESWSEFSFGDDAQLTSVQFVDSTTGFAAGEFGMVLKTTDAGESWEPMASIPGEFYSQAAHFIDARRGWTVGLNGAILATSDGGESWQSQDSGVKIPLYGITGSGEALYAVGENGIVLRYGEGVWRPLSHDNNVLSYLRAASADNGHLLVAGGNGVLFSLATGG
jgi:photosystem II stability/assembly factor-like uncharacterized protein